MVAIPPALSIASSSAEERGARRRAAGFIGFAIRTRLSEALQEAIVALPEGAGQEEKSDAEPSGTARRCRLCPARKRGETSSAFALRGGVSAEAARRAVGGWQRGQAFRGGE
jgi:hypothetical protein